MNLACKILSFSVPSSLVITLALALAFTGCSCTRHHASEAQLRQALADTNDSLTQCREDDAAAHRAIQKLSRKHVRNR